MIITLCMSIHFLPTNNVTASYSVSTSMRSDLSTCISDTICINIFYSTDVNFYCVHSCRLCDSVTLIDNAINLHIHDHY